jgi:hypothetical protein
LRNRLHLCRNQLPATSYFKPAGLSDLIDWCATIAAEAPGLPFYYYDIPSMSGVSFPIDRFLIEGSARIPSLAGVKFTNLDLVSDRLHISHSIGDRHAQRNTARLWRRSIGLLFERGERSPYERITFARFTLA